MLISIVFVVLRCSWFHTKAASTCPLLEIIDMVYPLEISRPGHVKVLNQINNLPASGSSTTASGVHGPALTYPLFSKEKTKPPSPITTSPPLSLSNKPLFWQQKKKKYRHLLKDVYTVLSVLYFTLIV